MSIFDPIQYDFHSKQLQQDFRQSFQQIAAQVRMNLPDSRAASLALTKLEEAYMWIGKSIRDHQIEREKERT